jgi:type IV pilus assembly protein PilC
MLTVVLPTFAGLYTSLGAQMPFMMQIMLDLGDLLRRYALYIVALIVIAVIAFIAYTKTARGRYNWDNLSLKFPLVGRVNHLNELATMSRSVAVLFKSGLPLTEILPLVIRSCNNKVIQGALMNIRDDMLGGEGLSRPMAKYPIFLPMLVQMVRVGEETGNLDSTLQSVAQSYEAEADDRMKTLIGMIQPVMTIIIGVVVAIMAVSLVSAMYSMYQGV